jgi:tetratricopeptide (TPR) repeat protein
LVTIALYLPALRHEFLLYDDQQYVTENRHVLTGLNWPGVAWAFKSYYASNWHPLTWLSHMLDCQLYGLHAWGHHLTNVLLHAMASVLLFVALQRMTGAVWRSAAVAAAFAWHPLHVESVAWIAERKDVLCGFFWMLTMLAYARYTECRRGEPLGLGSANGRNGRASVYYILTIIALTCALMSKPMAVTLPFVLLLLDYWPLRRTQWLRSATWQPEEPWRLVAEKIPTLVLAAVCCVLTLRAQAESYAIVGTTGLPLNRRMTHTFASVAHYLGALFLPSHLAVYYPYPKVAPVATILCGLGLVSGAIMLVIKWGRERPYLPVGTLWFLGTLAPVIGLVQVGDQAWADRYTYIPSIGVFLAIAWAVGEWFGRTRQQNSLNDAVQGLDLAQSLFLVVAVAAGISILSATSLQLRYWRNTRSLFEHAANVTKDNYRATAVLGSLLAAEGHLDEAQSLYAQALRIEPGYAEAHFLMGRALDQQGKLEQAVMEYRQALPFKALEEQNRIYLASALAKLGRDEEAAAQYRTVLASHPDSSVAHNNLARLLQSRGQLDEAIGHYSAALAGDPSLVQSRNNLGVCLLQKGNVAEGTAQLRQAVRLAPGNAEYSFNLGQALNKQGSWGEAAELLSGIVGSKLDDANAHYQLGLSLEHTGRTREAMNQYAGALIQKQDFPEALDALSWILATDPRTELRNGPEAVKMAESACSLTRFENASLLATLAAAYAEVGDFEKAGRTLNRAQKTLDFSRRPEAVKKCTEVAAACQSGAAFRTSPPRPR